MDRVPFSASAENFKYLYRQEDVTEVYIYIYKRQVLEWQSRI